MRGGFSDSTTAASTFDIFDCEAGRVYYLRMTVAGVVSFTLDKPG